MGGFFCNMSHDLDIYNVHVTCSWSAEISKKTGGEKKQLDHAHEEGTFLLSGWIERLTWRCNDVTWQNLPVREYDRMSYRKKYLKGSRSVTLLCPTPPPSRVLSSLAPLLLRETGNAEVRILIYPTNYKWNGLAREEFLSPATIHKIIGYSLAAGPKRI